jgi:hypothetical protein
MTTPGCTSLHRKSIIESSCISSVYSRRRVVRSLVSNLVQTLLAVKILLFLYCSPVKDSRSPLIPCEQQGLSCCRAAVPRQGWILKLLALTCCTAVLLYAETETDDMVGVWSFLHQASAGTPSSVSCRSPSASHQVRAVRNLMLI